jgi:hypothetical protein
MDIQTMRDVRLQSIKPRKGLSHLDSIINPVTKFETVMLLEEIFMFEILLNTVH